MNNNIEIHNEIEYGILLVVVVQRITIVIAAVMTANGANRDKLC